MRKIMKILGGLLVLGGIGAGLAFWLTSGITDVANTFFAKIREGDAKAAYELTSPGFRSATPLNAFQAYIQTTGLKSASAPSWSGRNINGTGDAATGSVSGSIKDAKGNSVPARLQLTKNNGKWVIHHIRISTGGTATNSQIGKIPAENDLIKLVHSNNLVIAQAIETKSAKSFHAHISERWRKQISIEKLQKILEPLSSRNPSFDGFATYTPAFDGPAKIDANGIMRLSGSYETRPMRIVFNQSYIQEGLGWKLFGFGFNMKAPKKEPGQ